ncbi:MAG: hypothetical protein HY577_02320 [Candidatus Nealsonbacteria bacterium]|nr:hypothetical protein [Candidatus Nealsonbacteria bacterium]
MTARFNSQGDEIVRSLNGTTISLVWRSTGDGYCQIDAKMTLPDGRDDEVLGKRVVAPCRGQDVRGTWEEFVAQVFEKFAEETDLLKDQIIPTMDVVRSVLHGIGI